MRNGYVLFVAYKQSALGCHIEGKGITELCPVQPNRRFSFVFSCERRSIVHFFMFSL